MNFGSGSKGAGKKKGEKERRGGGRGSFPPAERERGGGGRKGYGRLVLLHPRGEYLTRPGETSIKEFIVDHGGRANRSIFHPDDAELTSGV